jgi:hypothetical protein
MRSEPKTYGVNTGQLHPHLRIHVYKSSSKCELRLFWRDCNAALEAVFLNRPNKNAPFEEQVAKKNSAILVGCSLAAYGGEVPLPASEHICADFGTVIVKHKHDAIAQCGGPIGESLETRVPEQKKIVADMNRN